MTPLPECGGGGAALKSVARNLTKMSSGTTPVGGAAELAQVARLFTRGAYRAMAGPGRGLQGWENALAKVATDASDETLAELFDRGFELIKRNYRSEYVFKNSIVGRLVFGRHSPRTAAALLELRAGTSIVDVAVFNGTSTAYEIKTDLDDFSRLAMQMRAYEECFERVAVVTSPRLTSRALAVVPQHIGVIALRERGSLSEVRQPASNIGRLSQNALFGLLRRQEVLAILQRTAKYDIDVPPAQLWQRTRDLFSNLPIELAHAEVITQLRHRGLRAAALADTVPKSLRAMAYEVPLNASAAERVRGKLAAPAASFVS